MWKAKETPRGGKKKEEEEEGEERWKAKDSTLGRYIVQDSKNKTK